MSPTNGRPARALLVAGTATYRHPDRFAARLENLEIVPHALRTVAASLTRFGYDPATAASEPFLLDPEASDLRDAIRVVARTAPVAIVYYTGHGLMPEASPYYVLTTDADGARLEDTALAADDILNLLHRREGGNPVAEQPQVLVILDCCFSGQGGIETLETSLRQRGNPNVWILASAGSLEWAQQGRFAEAFKVALEKVVTGKSQAFIDPNELRIQIDVELRGIAENQRTSLFPPKGTLTGDPPPFFSNPNYTPEVAGLTVHDQDWVAKLRAAPGQPMMGSGFYVTGYTGRVRAVRDLAAWMRGLGNSGVAVVTGSPGSGKSTLLALPTLLSSRERAKSLLVGSPADSLPALAARLLEDLPVIGVYARGMDPYQITAEIAVRLGLSENIRDPADLLADLSNADRARKTAPRIVIIDAVDEAVNPQKIMDHVILPLTHMPGVKVVIGTRRHLLSPHVMVGSFECNLLIDLDTDEYHDPEALADYGRQLLLAIHEPDVPTPFRVAPKATTDAVVQAIVDRATATTPTGGRADSFLLVQLLALAVRSRDEVPVLAGTNWADQLPAGIGEAFDEDFASLGSHTDGSRALLSALAWAHGPGLPWESIWTSVARVVNEAHTATTPSLGSGDVRWLLQNRGRYIVEDLGPGHRSVFRPFHELLASYLRGEPSADALLDDSTAKAWQAHRGRTEAAITQALLGSIPTHLDGSKDWESAHPYLRSYLARHAHTAGPEIFARLVADPDYLAVADPSVLTPLLTPGNSGLRTTARAYRRARSLLGADLSENAAYIQEAFVAETGYPPSGQRIRPSYRTRLARLRRDDSLLTLSGHSGVVASVACGRTTDGRPLMASGGEDGKIRLWDPETGTLLFEPLTGHDDRVVSVAFGTRTDGRLLLASAGWDGTVRLWDPDSGAPTGEPLSGHAGRVASVAFGTEIDGRLFLASAGDDGTVRIWDPETSTPKGDPMDQGRGATSVAIGGRANGRPLLACGAVHQTIRLWHPQTGVAESQPLTGHAGQVTAVAFSPLANGLLLLASAGSDGIVRLWNPDAGTLFGAPLVHGPNVSSVAFGLRANGQRILASAGDDGTIRIWDPDTGNLLGVPLNHGHGVSSVAFGIGSDGCLILASGGDDGTVRIWDPDESTPAIGPSIGNAVRAGSVAFHARDNGQQTVASAHDDGTIRLWDPGTGAPAGETIKAHAGPVTSVAFGTWGDGDLILASGGRDGMVRVWDTKSGTPVSKPLVGHGYSVTSVAFGFHTDGQLLLASGGRDGTVRIWDTFTGASVGKPLRHDRRKLEPFGWKRVESWDSLGEGAPAVWSASGREDLVASVAFGRLSDGKQVVVSAGWDRMVRLWDLNTGALIHEALAGHTGRVASIAFGGRADGHPLLASGSDDGTVRIWDPETGALIGEPLGGHEAGVASVTFGARADGHPILASGSDDGTVRVWDLDTGSPTTRLRRRTSVNAVALHKDLLAIGDDEGIVIVELAEVM